MDDLPANQMALADTFKAIARGRPKTKKQHLADAEVMMAALRERGFRIVSFPPHKVRKKKGGRKTK